MFCGTSISFKYIRDEGMSGRFGHDLMCVVANGGRRRQYLPPNAAQKNIANQAKPEWFPNTSLPEKALGFSVQNYGVSRHSDLYTCRQLLALTTFSELVEEARLQIIEDSSGNEKYANSIVIYLAFAANRLMQTNNTLVRWLVRKSGTSKGVAAFDRQIVSMIWEFSEGNVFGNSVGSWNAAVKNVLTAFKSLPEHKGKGLAFQHDAAKKLESSIKFAISTDPPYFDNIGYADLSDFFYIWMRKSLKGVYPEVLDTMLTPKSDEIIYSSSRFAGDKKAAERHFIDGLRNAFAQIRQYLHSDYPLTVYYAFKQSEEKFGELASTGWETMLEALLDAGFAINGTWPIATERKQRLRAVKSNALASSIVLVCRPRPEDAPATYRRRFLDALRAELPAAIAEMKTGSIAPVDLAQASIGPGMAIYSRYSRVLEADGTPLTVRTALGLINAALDEALEEQDAQLDAETRFAVGWFEECGFKDGDFGRADVLARGKNTSVESVALAGVVESQAGKVRLVNWREYDPGAYDPQQDKRPTVWEGTHHLVERLNHHGEVGAAALFNRLPGDIAESVRDLAYRLHNICERKGWAEDALDYNALGSSWSEISRLAASGRESGTQAEMAFDPE